MLLLLWLLLLLLLSGHTELLKPTLYIRLVSPIGQDCRVPKNATIESALGL